MLIKKIKDAFRNLFPSRMDKSEYQKKRQIAFDTSINEAFDQTIKVLMQETNKVDPK